MRPDVAQVDERDLPLLSKTEEATMRVLTIDKLTRLTRVELIDLLVRMLDMLEGSPRPSLRASARRPRLAR